MSQWYEANYNEIEIDTKQREFNIFVTDNDFGSVYVTLKFDIVKKLAEEVSDEEKP